MVQFTKTIYNLQFNLNIFCCTCYLCCNPTVSNNVDQLLPETLKFANWTFYTHLFRSFPCLQVFVHQMAIPSVPSSVEHDDSNVLVVFCVVFTIHLYLAVTFYLAQKYFVTSIEKTELLRRSDKLREDKAIMENLKVLMPACTSQMSKADVEDYSNEDTRARANSILSARVY